MWLMKAPVWLAGCTAILLILAATVAGAELVFREAPDFYFPWHTMPHGVSEWTRLALAVTAMCVVTYVSFGLGWRGFKSLTDWTFGDSQATEESKR